MRAFWEEQAREVAAVPANDPAQFKNSNLPLARIKKIMKSDEDVRMISAEAPVLFARACEMFILELTLRAWAHAEENKRRTLQRNDVAAAITRTDIFDFLVDIVPREALVAPDATAAAVAATAAAAAAGGGAAFWPGDVTPPGAEMLAAGAAGAPVDPAMLMHWQQQAAASGAAWPGGVPPPAGGGAGGA